jgi:hypothetical protein
MNIHKFERPRNAIDYSQAKFAEAELYSRLKQTLEETRVRKKKKKKKTNGV